MKAAEERDRAHVEVKRCPDCAAQFGLDAGFCPFDGVPLVTGTWDPAADPLRGRIVDGRYEVLEPLGEGGMGTVYKVRHVTLDRLFAMKVLRRDLADDAALAKRFLQEARATAAVKHPSVVAISDYGEIDGGLPYFVMELLRGETLTGRLRAGGPLPPRAATKIARQIAEGLEASHAANVIHRDLKPENVFLVGKAAGKAPEDEVRIVDFGAAKIVGASKLTRPGIVFGTPWYMSPEQASGQNVDGRADVYSLGVLLYEMVTGRVPFEADTYMGVLTKHMFTPPPNPSDNVPPGVHLGELEAIILRALQKDPAFRFPSMRAFADELGRLENADASSVPQHRPSRTTADRIEEAVERIARDARRERRKVVLAATSACVVVAAVVLVATWSRDEPVRASPAPPASQVPPPAVTVPQESVTAAEIPPPEPEEPPAPPATSSTPPPKPKVIPKPAKPPPKPRIEEFKDPWRTN